MAIYETSPDSGPLRQGEVLSNVVELRLAPECLTPHAEPLFVRIVHPYAIVLTQDCDLDWDHRARFPVDPNDQTRLANKKIPNVLFCQADKAEAMKGTQGIKSDIWRRIANNSDERYHVLPDVPAVVDKAAEGIPSLALDFKLLFTVASDELYYRLGFEAKRRCFLLPPFLQSLSSRFSYFMGRVALPETAQHAAPAALVLPPPAA